ncbi:alginate export family protein [Verrucomicrobium spinosum]|uniref:alginate export family protein n=1 Tax=Verrucomicrobium spinosum TaxID=2736 RepID=UPI00094614EE|nr:alginate export family protein [Verrucomicrobium spinosum]
MVIPPPEPKIVTFDFQERLRFEYRENNFDFNDGVNSLTDDSWLLQRARVGIKVSPTDYLSFYVQGQSSLELDSDRPNEPGVMGAEGDDAIDLRQAYIKIGPKDLNITIGRQILSYGDERLIGAFDWNNLSRTFDAVKFHYGTKDWSIEPLPPPWWWPTVTPSTTATSLTATKPGATRSSAASTSVLQPSARWAPPPTSTPCICMRNTSRAIPTSSRWAPA